MTISGPSGFGVVSISSYIAASAMFTSVPSVVASVSGWVSGVLVVAGTGVGCICVRRKRHVDLRV